MSGLCPPVLLLSPSRSVSTDSRSSRSSQSSHGSAPPEETLIICDWDDTLLPTSWLQQYAVRAGQSAVRSADLSERQRQHLGELEEQLLLLLTALASLGTPIIITNAVERYVELTAAAFLPRVAAWLTAHEVSVVSARSWYGWRFPTDVAAWKLHAFQDVVQAWRDSHGGQAPSHILSVGDSLFERWAAHSLAVTWGDDVAAIKTIKLRELPSCQDLTAQAKFLARHATSVAALEGDMDMSVVLPPRRPDPAPTNWNLEPIAVS